MEAVKPQTSAGVRGFLNPGPPLTSHKFRLFLSRFLTPGVFVCAPAGSRPVGSFSGFRLRELLKVGLYHCESSAEGWEGWWEKRDGVFVSAFSQRLRLQLREVELLEKSENKNTLQEGQKRRRITEVEEENK
ncbi:hypothetical protein JOB18_022831 [Solea senegalensis]|uniref:Uncharacterized protein n=1 Tax=Solea senegalensis TaxID=28829 RepID=A0AAV6QWE3_SOLSE|nr:hypothetical protein JOB18_022831 [Solea senegalensis]